MRIVIPLSDASSDALRELAGREFRDPRMQAKLLLERALNIPGALPELKTAAGPELASAAGVGR